MTVRLSIPFDVPPTAIDRNESNLKRGLVKTFIDGANEFTNDEHIHVLTTRYASKRIARHIIRIEIPKNYEQSWLDKMMSVQKKTNRKTRDRFPTFAIALSLSKYYNVPIRDLISSDSLSEKAFRILTVSSIEGSSIDKDLWAMPPSSPENKVEGAGMTERQASNATIELKAVVLSGAEAASQFSHSLADLPPGPLLSDDEADLRLQAMIDRAGRALAKFHL